MSHRFRARPPRLRRALGLVAILALLAACTTQTQGTGTQAQIKDTGNADFPITGAVGSDYDKVAAKAMSDIEAFWTKTMPTIDNGKKFTPLAGGTWSVNGSNPTTASRKEACLAKDPSIVKDNLMHCRLDDSVVYDRTSSFFVNMAKQTGDFTIAAIFAHEMGHAIQYRLGTEPDSTVLVETQADCFAGAWIGWVLAGNAKYFRISGDELDTTLTGYIQLRDPDGSDSSDTSAHGNGFDRVAAVADGVQNGAAYCTQDWANRQITERPYTSQADYDAGGNLPYDGTTDGSDTVTLGPQDLEAFWSQAFADSGRTWEPVKAEKVAKTSCTGAKLADIGYCPTTNTVEYKDATLKSSYRDGDFSAMTMLGIGWGLAVVKQLGRDPSTADALLAASCYQGAYAATRNVAEIPPGSAQVLTLSPADMDEASVALLTLVGQSDAYGARGTQGYERIQYFVTGYFGGLGAC